MHVSGPAISQNEEEEKGEKLVHNSSFDLLRKQFMEQAKICVWTNNGLCQKLV